MVFGQTQSQNESENSTKLQLASVQDRFLAFVFDGLIFAPIFSFFLAQVLKNIELLYYTAPGSFEFMALLGICTLMSCIMAVLFQTVFLLLFGATPGKIFMKIRVVSVSGSPKLSFSQALIRSSVWVLEFLLLGLPMLEVLSHGLRRSLHDRASDTVVKTLKVQGDRGPHFLEAQFIRQMLLAIFLMVITWGIFLTGNLYRMVLAGDFTKSELAESKYLCDSISSRATKKDNRVDMGIALFLTDTISADCLTAEADFAMWTLSEEQKAWAYYAKMILSTENDEKKSAYQGKVCSMSSELCDLSNGKLDTITEDSHFKNSHTFAILKIQGDLYQANVPEVKKDLETLEGMNGFRDYAQSAKIKLFWLEDKPEKALGAFDTVAFYMADFQSQKLSGWLCHQEMDEGCQSKSYLSCQTLRKQVGTTSPVEDISTAFALIRESQCKKTSMNYVQVEDVFAKDKKAFKLLRAIDEKSEMPEKMRKAILIEMATQVTDREDVVSDLAKQFAFEHELDRKDIKLLSEYLGNSHSKNLVWQKLYSKTVQAAMKINDKENLRALLSFMDSSKLTVAKAKEREQMALAFYQIEDYKKSWDLLKSGLPEKSGRNPASASEDVVTLVRRELSRRFGVQ